MAVANNDTNVIDDEKEFDLEEFEIEPIGDDATSEQPAMQLDVISVKRENTRGVLAFAFLIGFFIILLAGMLLAALDAGNRVDNIKEIVLVVSGILSGPLGFVIGYYFRSSEE